MKHQQIRRAMVKAKHVQHQGATCRNWDTRRHLSTEGAQAKLMSRSQFDCSTLCVDALVYVVIAVSYTHLTLPTTPYV